MLLLALLSLRLGVIPMGCRAEVLADLIDELPGFPKAAFKAFSGYLAVPGPFRLSPDVAELRIHYQLHLSQSNPAEDPVVTWHQGGPGVSSILVGLYTEMGYFQLDSDGPHTNPYSWNRVANMLYLESPAGSGETSGYSTCHSSKNGPPVTCHWDDQSQGEAYANTLMAFFRAFPELAKNELYLTGESYFGQYGPNIAHFILNHEPFASALNLKGMALGNACWGGNETSVLCNGPHGTKNDADLFFGKSMISPALHVRALGACQDPETPDPRDPGSGRRTRACAEAAREMDAAVGPYNIYNLYDDCPQTGEWLHRSGRDMHWLRQEQRRRILPTWSATESSGKEMAKQGAEKAGGYDWSCGGMDAADAYMVRPDVRKALHLGTPGQSPFRYTLSGPASITLYPELVKKLHIFIYNGDADACVPYIGNQEWISGLVAQGVLREKTEWKPWFAEDGPQVAAGYATEYTVPGSNQTFSFHTVRLAGHMVPTFQPKAALALFRRFLAGGRRKGETEQSAETMPQFLV